MTGELVDRLARAVLYEGYNLYPYRATSVKNQRRFNFGVFSDWVSCEHRLHETIRPMGGIRCVALRFLRP